MRLSPSLTALTMGFIVAVVVPFFHPNDARASTNYVNAANLTPAPPYASWLTAATNIQDAIAMTTNGDTVLVTNGVYAFGGAAIIGTFTNRVALTNAITVESVNGPWVTTILGAGMTNGNAAVRCAWLTNGASLVGFTLMGGATATSGDLNGGGVWCASSNAYIQNCVIISNTAGFFGGGVYQGTLSSCLISGNKSSSFVDGVVYAAVLNNCTIVSNTVGVASLLAMTNCIVYYNGNNQNYYIGGNANSHCCTTPTLAGTGNFTNAPSLFADGVHLANGSPCIGAGVYIGSVTDIFGINFSNPPSVGCAEWRSAPLVATPQIKLTSSPVGFSVGNAAFTGVTPCNFSWLQNGQPLADNGHFSGSQTSNLMAAGVSLADAGNYQVVVSNAFGAVTSAPVALIVHCVNGSGLNPVAPYTSWATAATNIQDAITASADRDVVLVTNGLYNSGGISLDGLITNRVSINKAILLQSVNGPAATIIQGAWNATSTNGPGAVRCVWITNSAILSGFTICGGATREASASGFASDGGGVLVTSTNSAICNCILSTNNASDAGGGVYGAGGILYISPTIINCTFLGNKASQASGGGANNCKLRNCALIGNSASLGGAANGGMLINCTIVSNSMSGFAVTGATLTNCIVIGNASGANYASSTLAYCCADPLPPGPGNIDVNPQVLADGFHLAQTSPCIGAGLSNVVSGTDIDGQPWNTPPSIGCDEWYPAPLIAVQPSFQVGSPPHDLTWNVAVAGQTPFAYFWTQNGAPIQDDGHHSNSGTANMVINNFGPCDAGVYQVVVTNSWGSVTSTPVQVVIHAVNASGANPLPPYSSWANAATTIQDAVNIAAPGDIVLVTNGTYSHGGMALVSGLTNRVALNKALTVMSVNGFKNTIIEGAWDPISTNGPGAVRCAYVGDGAVLNGFTLANGATYATGDGYQYGPLESGGGILCNSSNGVILECELTNNSAVYGGGAAYGTVDNSLIVGNMATYGGGALFSTLNNCTVTGNLAFDFDSIFQMYAGAGTFSAIVRNSIVIGNLDYPFGPEDDAYAPGTFDTLNYAYSCLFEWDGTLPSNAGNIINGAGPIFIDLYHISTLSPCYEAGSAAYATGYDLDGNPWNNPPSMGCSEIIFSNLVGPLSVYCSALFTNLIVANSNPMFPHYDTFYGTVQGRAAYLTWSFSDGPVSSNLDGACTHQWASPGDYPVVLTAYNNDNPNGVSTNLMVHVQLPLPAQIQSSVLLTNGFKFQFAGQMNADYTIDYATNLTPPVSWQSLEWIFYNTQSAIQIVDTNATNAARFYRVNNQ